MSQPLSRASTGLTHLELRKSDSFKIAADKKSKAKPTKDDLKQILIDAYDLTREALKGYLESQFPGHDFESVSTFGHFCALHVLRPFMPPGFESHS